MKIHPHTLGIAIALVAACGGVFAACTAGDGSSKFGGGTPEPEDGTEDGMDDGFTPTGGGGPNNCEADPATDADGDGFTGHDGDCNNCDVNTNPRAVEVITDANDPDAVEADENCDGEVDVIVTCDDGMAVTEFDPIRAAAALDLCDLDADKGQGIISAQWVRANGTPVTSPTDHVGVRAAFGSAVTPRLGAGMLALSSGHARTPGETGACNAVSCGDFGAGTAPTGFPQDVPSCSGAMDINDDVGLEVQLRAPSNATGFQYDFNFYSHEYPEFVCTMWNDQYIALVTPAPMGSINGNISFDSQNNPVSVNIALFDVCSGCSLGTGELMGTGFDQWGGGVTDSGATSWLVTTAPIEAGAEFTIRFAIWDTGDDAWDSTVLIDNFTWIGNGGNVDVGTLPVPE